MSLLIVDLGVRSGVAVLSLQGDVLSHETVHVDDLEKRLLSLFRTFDVEHYVVERPVIYRGHLGEELARGLSIVEMVSKEPFYIEANWWKSHPRARLDVPAGCTPHERDAIRMGWVYLRRELQG